MVVPESVSRMSVPIKQIAIDFDGCLQLHEHPYLGKPAPGAIDVVKRLSESGHILILLTMRCDEELEDAKTWLRVHDLNFDHFNCNPLRETGSRKVYAHYYLDDHGVGVPLTHDFKIHRKPFVDWEGVKKIFEEKGLI